LEAFGYFPLYFKTKQFNLATKEVISLFIRSFPFRVEFREKQEISKE
jgi:hypothetical protein